MKLKMFLATLAVVLGCFVGTSVSSVEASAAVGEEIMLVADGETQKQTGAADWITEEPSNDIFGGVTDKFQEGSRSAYRLLLVIGLSGFVLCGMAAGILVMITRNTNKRTEIKDWMIWIVAGGLIIFGILSIAGLVMTVGGSI